MTGSDLGPSTARTGLLHSWPWAGVALLTLVNTVNYLDRTLPMILAEQLKSDLDLSDTTLGLLNGIGFTLVYALAGLPIARIADRGRQGLVITASLGFWSLMTALGSLATSAWLLGLSRMGVAIGEAGNTPAAHAYISRSFPADRRAAPLAVLTMAAAIGTMIGLAGGGLMAQAIGWRGTMLVLGGIGLAMAPIVLILLGPGTPVRDARIGTVRDVIAQLRKRSIVAMLLALCFMSMASYSLGAFGPAFLVRTHGLPIGQVGVQLGLMNGAIGILALLATAWLADRLTRTDPRWGLAILQILIVATIPLAVAAFRVEDGRTATILIGASYGVMAIYMVLTVVPIHSLVPNSMRAQASAVVLFSTSVIGGFGPAVTGVISDALTPTHGPFALGYAMMTVPLCLALGAVFYLFAIRSLRADLESGDQAERRG